MHDEKIKIFFPPATPGRPFNTLSLLFKDGGHELRTEIWRFFNAYDRLIAEGRQHWEVVGLDEAEVVVDSHWLYDIPGEQERVDHIAELAQRHGKPCLFFQISDFQLPCAIRYGTVYRTSIYASRRTPNEAAMPGENDDMLLEERGVVPLRTWTDRPTVSFCGNLSNRWNELLLTLAGKHINVVGTRLRRKTIRLLRRSPGVQTSIIARQRYWGGSLRTFFGKSRRDTARQQTLRDEYKQNMLESDYVLCLRGAGNYSFRFYETLSAGRIPLLIDTDCALPFADEVDWSRHCCIVPVEDLAHVGTRLEQYHQNLGPEEFMKRQRDNRALWAACCEVFAFYHRALAKEAGRNLPPLETLATNVT
jgi:hypothetical protein